MNRNQNERIRNLERPIPGCLGRMVNLFDLNANVGGNRLLTEKPHYEGYPVSRSQSNVSRSCVVDDHMHDKVMVSGVGKSPSNRKPNGAPIKMLMVQEMSKKEVPKKGPPSLVAKLMGLDDLPQQDQLGSDSCRSNVRGSRSRSHSGSLEFIQKEHDAVHQYKDVSAKWQQKGSKYKESKNEKNMAFIREKFMEAKRLSTDEKLRQSKQFQDALEVLNSNKDLFLEFLQEPNSLFSQKHNLQSLPPRPDSKRITILKPSKLIDGHKLPCSGKENGKQMKEAVWDRFSGTLNQPTRIVVLKPDSGKPHEMRTVSSSPSLKTSNDDGFYGDLEDSEPKEWTPSIPESLSGHRRDETLLSSVFSNGYIGDESSFSKSEVYYAAGNLSDSEVMSPTSRHSWDYINRFGSLYSSSSFSRASCSPESSVCREAKKRLSERWAMMSLNGSVQEQRHVKRNSSTLGEMLALSDLKKSAESEENGKYTSDLNNNKVHDADNNPNNPVRSKSLPVSSPGFLKGKKDETKDLTLEKGQKSSLFIGNVSRLFFSRDKTSNKQKFQKSDNEVHQFSRNIGGDGSQCINNPVVKDLPESSGNANENPEQPSPVSVLELQFEDNHHTSSYSSTAKLNKIEPNKYNWIDKSPPIGSISRTLSWDYSTAGTVTHVPGKTSTKPSSPGEEEQEFFLYVQTLLSAAGINGGVQSDSVIARWHSPESPLDPSLRDKYMNISDKEPRSKQRHRRSYQKLVFDCVNDALTLSSCTHKHMGKSPMDRVWGQMKEWISGEERCDWDWDGGDEDEDGGGTATLAVERVVRKQVAGQVWMDQLKLEIDDIKMEIEGKLVEQLVDEFVLELTGRVILAYIA